MQGKDLAEQLRTIAAELQEALLPLTMEATGGILRPSRLVQMLGIDKSLAGRVIRALRCEDPLDLLHHTPAPTGLRILVKAARAYGVEAKICDHADNAIEGFLALIDVMPGGRGGLDAWISAHSADARERSEHSAKQAIYRGMSYLLGCRCETVATTLVLKPSGDGKHVDGFELHQRLGLRRMRPSAPVALFSLFLERGVANGEEDPWIETLAGVAEAEDPTRYLLEDYCSDPLPGIEIVTRDKHTIFALAEGGLSLEAPINLSSGYRLNRGWQLKATPQFEFDSRAYLLNYPCKTLVRDVFVHKDLWIGSNPEISLKLPNPSGTESIRHTGYLGTINTLDLTAPIEQLGRGLSHTAQRDLPGYRRLLDESFAKVDWDPGEFQGYRTRLLYPVPMITMTWWFQLPK